MKTTPQLTYLLLAGLLLLASTLAAEDLNSSAAAYVRMGIGARIIAMGEAGSTVTRDVVSGYWNPAGLTSLKDIEVGTMYNFGLNFDRTHTYLAIGNRFDFGALALTWISVGTGDIYGTDENGQFTGYFSDREHNLSVSYANSAGRFSFGATPKLYISTIDGDTETGYGLDVGLKTDINQYLEAGLMARDLVGSVANERVPFELTAGVAAYPLTGLTVAADLKWEQEENPYLCLGAEYWTSIGKDPEADSQLSVVSVGDRSTWADMLSNLQTGLRLGYSDERISAGTGFRFRNLQLDYAFRLNRHDIFANDHILSLIFRF